MSPWLPATIALLPPLGVAVALAVVGPAGHRLVAVQLATSVGLLVLAAMTFVFDQASSIDLAVTLGILSLPAGFLFAVVTERWL